MHAALDCPERGFSYSNYGAALAGNLLRVRPRDHHAVIEAGIGGPGWMDVYAWFLQPDIVVVTSIKSDHHRAFPTLEHTRDEKVHMVERLGADKVAFLNGDDPHVRWMATRTSARVVTFGLGEDNDVRAVDIQPAADGMRFDALLRTCRLTVRTRFVGEHMVYPFLAALAVTEWEGGDPDAAAARLGALEPADSRMELFHSDNGIAILDDSIKGGYEGMHAALDAFAELPAGRKLFLLGEVEDPPGKQSEVNHEIGRHLAGVADRVFFLGGKRALRSVRAGAVAAGLNFDDIVMVGPDIESTTGTLLRELRPGDALLVKGRSTLRLRRVVLRLLGRKVACTVGHCGVKVTACDACPLLDAPPEWFGNHYIARYVRE
jgi:UDP-N-acetylmuramoyl-tripeptide--D-alanyl-D-alanine ligase